MDSSSPRPEATLERCVRQQQAVAALGTRALELDDLEELFREAAETITTTVDTETCAVLESRPDAGVFLLREGYGWDETDASDDSTTVAATADSQAGYTLETGESTVVTDHRIEDRFSETELPRAHDAVSGLCVVIGTAAAPWGVLETQATTRRDFDEGDVAFVEAVGNVLASAIERGQANRRQHEAVALTDTIAETSPIGITVVDTDGEIQFANDRVEDIFGRTEAEITDCRFDDPEWDEISPDGDQLTADELPFSRIVDSETPLFDQISGVLRPNGERIWISVNGAPLFDDHGALDGVVFAIEDVTTQFHRDRRLERYETAVETAHDGIYVLDDERRFELVNESFAELTRFSRLELHGRHASDVFGETFSTVETEQRVGARGPKSPVFEETIIAGPNETRTVESRFDIIVGDDGTEKRVGVVRDVTDRKHLESELETMLDRVTDAFTAIDTDWTYTYVNDHAAALLNVADRELVGETVWEAFPSAVGTRFETEYRNAMATQESTSFEAYSETADAWLEVNLYPSETGLSVYFRDVSDRRAYEQQLQRFERLVETVRDGVYITDSEGRFVFVNDAFVSMSEHTRAALLGAHGSVFFGDRFVDTDEDEWRDLVAGEDDAVAFETTVIGPNGDPRSVQNKFVLFEMEGETGRVGVTRDVTDRKQMEAALRESEQQFRTLAEHLEETIWLAGADPTELFYINPSYEDVYGRSRDSLYEDPLSFLEVVHPDDRERVRTRYLALPEREYDEEFRIGTDDGETRWIHARAVPVSDADGAVVGIVGIDVDITDRKERERRLSKYETIVEAVDDGIYTVDDEDRFTMVNRAYTELTGYSRTALLGAHASLVADADVIERARNLAPEPDETKIESALKTAAGDRVQTEATLTTHVDEESEERRRIGVVRDITERKARQRKLEESRQRYRTLVDHFPNGAVALFDDDLRYTLAGGEMLEELDISRSELIGTCIYDQYPDDVADDIEPKFRAALAGEEHTFEFTYEGRDHLTHTLPVRNDDGEVFAGMLMVQDITTRKEYRRRLEESNERLEQFAYAASHDLQEPLRMVSSYLQLIEDRYGDDLDGDGQEFLEFAVDGAERMRDMIAGLLEFSRIETQGKPFEPIELDDVLADVRRDLGVQIDEHDAEITAASLPRVEGDGNQLRQVFQNLLSNAIEYSGDEPPRIDVSAHRAGSEWVISVRDNGIGIDPDDTDRVFEIFQRLHPVDESAGSGIGLALCERIIERHDGNIWIDSEPGEGATVSFTLPRAQADEPATR
ncbi:PAS domain S-box protein [Natronorubrum sulfidifaciens]|uniref:histidine kinase n=1 Tax=Natronorubrum sulfidifaciens JCM 14089 TaxID=1230460 RepID=L9W898_9EURY|nr:PAS domain S-box protein [Natronorubrum sulfidifaciens]ELY44523.1 multi-sensor signal transduction histidine kinase [Natronorubrum sulfidifaciens JCM 14089]